MKKYYYLACMLLSWLAFAANAQSPDISSKTRTVSDVEGRTVYCALFGDQTIEGYGISSFQTGSQEEISLLHKWGNKRFIYAGAAANGDYYVQFYTYDNGGGNMSDSFSKINLRTGEDTKIKDWSDFEGKLKDMTYDYSTNKMYATGFISGVTRLFTIDLKTGERTMGPIFTTNEGNESIVTIAATYDGRLYGTDHDGVLYQIDKETGYSEKIMELNQKTSTFQSIEFDHTDECLYYATSTMPGSDNDRWNYLLKIDIEKKTFVKLGKLGGDEGTVVTGLYIPFVLAGFDAPGLASDLKVVPASEGKEEAMISWKNPTKTHGGKDLTGSMSIILERDGEVISNSLGTPGEEMSWNDMDVKQGEHIYSLKVSNTVGEGVLNDMDAYVGKDVPDYVKDLTIAVGTDCKSIKLKWSIPEKGAHNGYYDKSNVKFKIIRYPDNKVVAENYEGTSFEDNTMKRLGAYSYGIVASNAAGSNKEYTLRNIVVAGKDESIPYYCGFDDATEVKNKWTIEDANKDDNAFVIAIGWGSVFFGDITFSAEYLRDQNSTYDADEWLISPPLNFERGKKYYIKFDTRSWGVNEFNLTVGKLNTPEAQTQYVQTAQFTVDGSEDETLAFTTHTYQLPELEGIYCVGINLVTEYNAAQYFQLNNLDIAEGEVDPSGIESTSIGENIKVMMNGDQLVVEGDFRTVIIYDATGIQVASLNQQDAQVSTSNWEPGLYIVKVANADSVYTRKIMVK